MKDPLLSLICAFALLFSACSKEETAAPKEEERYSVTLNVSTLSHDMVPMASIKPTGPVIAAASSGKKLSDVIDYLSYAIYHEDGRQILQRSMYVGGSDFDKIDEVLSKGKYKVIVVGSWQQGSGSPWTFDDNARIYNYNLSDDIFFDHFELVVSDSNIEKKVELKRKVGKVKIELTDKIPLNIGEIRYSIEGVSDWFAPKTNRGENTVALSKSLFFQDDGSPYFYERETFSFYFFLDKDEEAIVNIKLAAYDRNQQLAAEKVIENVPVSINRTTKVRGRLFEDAYYEK